MVAGSLLSFFPLPHFLFGSMPSFTQAFEIGLLSATFGKYLLQSLYS